MTDTPEHVKTATIDDIAGGDMPEVKQNAIDAVNQQKSAEIEKAVKVDGFNPDIHATDASGQPLRNKNGSLKKKRGRKKGATNSTLQLQKENPQNAPEPSMDSLEAAIVISGLLEAAQVKLISDEFIYNELERTGNIEAWKRTLDHYGGIQLSPPQALVLSHMQIIVTRAMSPENKKTQEKFKLIGAWFKVKISKFKFKKKRDEKDGSHADSRKDAKRKNNSGDEAGKSETKAGN